MAAALRRPRAEQHVNDSGNLREPGPDRSASLEAQIRDHVRPASIVPRPDPARAQLAERVQASDGRGLPVEQGGFRRERIGMHRQRMALGKRSESERSRVAAAEGLRGDAAGMRYPGAW